LGIYPAVDPPTSRILDPLVVGEEHYHVAQQVEQILQRYRDLQDIIAILASTSCPTKTRRPWRARARSSGSFRSRSRLPKPAPAARASIQGGRHGAQLQGSGRGQARQRARAIEDVLARWEEMKKEGQHG